METDTANLALPPPQPQREVNFLSITRSREWKSEEGFNLKLDFDSRTREGYKKWRNLRIGASRPGRENICPMYHPLYPSHRLHSPSLSLSLSSHAARKSDYLLSISLLPSARPPTRRSFNEWFSPSQTSLPPRFIRTVVQGITLSRRLMSRDRARALHGPQYNER